ncbi:MAG: VOC family protein [Myxococcota bacterium]|nr:VOC family protein [Myxococcota bacterium]
MSRIFGPVRQNGYVVHDIEAALKHWTEVLGVGPFFYFERAPILDFSYRGEASELEVSIALANSGDLQIELIQQRNQAPSSYLDFLATGREGLQHVAYWSQDFDASLAQAKEHGFVVEQSGCAGSEDGRFVYFENPGHPGTMVELSEVSGPKGAFFAHLAALSRDWDGSDPIRRH